MLREETNGDFVGEFVYKDKSYEYRVRGYGKPVLITACIAPRFGSYAWRYIFECLAGTNFVYSLDIDGMCRDSGRFRPAYYVKLLETFLREIVGTRSTILAGDREYAVATAAAFEARAMVDRILLLCPGGIGGYGLRGAAIAPKIAEMVRMPSPGRLRKVTEGTRVCTDHWPGARALPGGKSPFRVCEDIMRLLG